MPSPENPRIDLGLALLSRRASRGRCYTLKEIAAWCDCSLVRIGQIERKALATLRRKIDGQGFRVWRTK